MARGRTRSRAVALLGALVLLAGPALAQSTAPPLPTGAISRVGRTDLGYGLGHVHARFALLKKGSLLAYPGATGIVVFDIEKRRPVRTIPGDSEVHRIDDDHLLTGAGPEGPESTVSVWDLRQDPAKKVYTVRKHFSDPLSVSLNAARLAIGDYDTHEIAIYDAATGKQVSLFKDDPSLATLPTFALSNTGKYLVLLVPGNEAVLIWNAATKKTKRIRLPKEVRGDEPVCFSKDAKTLALFVNREEGGQLALVQSTRGKVRRRIPMDRMELFDHLSLSPNGALILTLGEGKGSLWDAATGEPRAGWKGRALPSPGQTAFSADGSRVAIGFPPSSIRVWDTKTGKEIAPPEGTRAEPFALAFSPDGARLTSIWSDEMTRTSIVADGSMMLPVKTPRSSESAVLVAPSASRRENRVALASSGLAVVSSSDSVTVCDLAKGGQERVLATGLPYALATAPGGARVAVSTEDRVVVWDVATQKPVATMMTEKPALAVALSSDGARVAVSVAGEARVYEVATGKVLHRVPLHRFAVLCFSPNGRALAIAEDVWDTKTWKKLVSLPTKGEGELLAIAFSPDSTLIAVGAMSGRAGIFDASGKALRTLEDGHVAPVSCLAWSADGKRLATGSADTTILIWDVSGL